MKPDLDDAIDAVAREMTAVEPSASMRGLVLDRIARERERTGLAGFAGLDARRWAWAGAAAVLVIGIAAGLILLRQGAGREAGTPQPGAAQTVAHAKPAPVFSQPAVAVPDSAAAERLASRGPRQVVQPEQKGLAADAGPAPLAGPDAIDIAPLGPDVITIPELGVTPLGEIQPLTITPAGPGQGEPQRRDER